MLRIILWILLGYFLYRFVVNFLIPVFKVSRQMRRQVRDFQNHMQAQQQYQQHQSYQEGNNAQRQQPSSTPSREKSGDYIDFEEVK